MITTGEPEPALTRGRLYLILSGLVLGLMVAGIDTTVLSVAIPTIAGDFGHLDLIAWVITANVLTQTAAAPIFGKLGDLYGRKRLFQIAIAVFISGSVLCALARNLGQLIAFRAVQGIGGGGLMVLAAAMVGDIVPPAQRPRYQALMQAVNAMAIVAGPIVGGAIIDRFSWRWIFTINIPVGLLGITVVAIALPNTELRREHRIDYVGAALLTGGLTASLLAGTLGGRQHAWTSPAIISLAVLGIGCLAGFIAVERRVIEPILPLEVLTNAIVRLTAIVGFANSMVMFGVAVYLPMFFQMVLGLTPSSAGTLTSPAMFSSMIVAIAVGHFVARTGRYKVVPIFGFAMLIVTMALFATTTTATTKATVVAFQLVFGLSFGSTQQVLTLAAQNAVDHRHLGVATSATNLFRSMGGVVGAAFFSVLINARFSRALDEHLPAGVTVASSIVSSPTRVRALEPATQSAVREAFLDAIHMLFYVGAGIGAFCLIASLFLKEIPLRRTIKSDAELRAQAEAPAPVR